MFSHSEIKRLSNVYYENLLMIFVILKEFIHLKEVICDARMICMIGIYYCMHFEPCRLCTAKRMNKF